MPDPLHESLYRLRCAMAAEELLLAEIGRESATATQAVGLHEARSRRESAQAEVIHHSVHARPREQAGSRRTTR